MDVYSWPGYTNGAVPLSAMVALDASEGQWVSDVGRYAHPEVAARVRWVIAECRRQGLNSIWPNEIYRDFAGQVYWKVWWTAEGDPGNAATPGGSPHGWGKAIDWNFADSEWAAFKAIADRAGLELNIPGEDWHTGATEDSSVNLNSVPLIAKDWFDMATAEDLDASTGKAADAVIAALGQKTALVYGWDTNTDPSKPASGPIAIFGADYIENEKLEPARMGKRGRRAFATAEEYASMSVIWNTEIAKGGKAPKLPALNEVVFLSLDAWVLINSFYQEPVV